MFSTTAATLVSLLALLPLTVADPVQYCRFGYPAGEADFCLSLSTTLNTTTSAHDVYLTLRVPRSSPHGWTAVGTGPRMAGSLMFIVYGSPTSAAPVLSIRTADGHHQPRALADASSLHLLHAKWTPLLTPRHDDAADYPRPPSSPATHTADIALACYACTAAWPSLNGATPLSLGASQPWIWAWNDRQEFPSPSPAVSTHLEMHRHHSGSGGFGAFYVDMARSLSPVQQVAPITPGVARLGTSDDPIGVGGLLASFWERPAARVHGVLMGLAFLVAFPAGAAIIRTGGGRAFARHWVLQAGGTGLAWAGAGVGAVMTGGRVPRTVHEWIGAVVVLAVSGQAVLGWRHHVAFLRVRRRMCISHAHVWLGRGVLVVRWVNVWTGVILAGHRKFGLAIGIVSALMLVDVVVVGLWLWRTWRQPARRPVSDGQAEAHALMPRTDGAENYFALELSDDEAESDGEADLGKEPMGGNFARKSVDAGAVKS
ncbi:hypothetical protein B0T25DRAFT_508652 [Lasiosphaeria hispida]|uniref:Cytochrome b561 domain-containing protein n=1 Tax=Lasiosphaeria hispida TaxID=260671 RepID=A0AAJ0M965_9PEZI|nr:hypothetical protein B0T25DRAFT_508652 [Lasiosphaeria hispida]